MKQAALAGLCLVMMAALAVAAGDDALPQARKLLLRGKYAEAAELYSPLAEKDPAAAVGLARCRAAEGKLDEAVKTLTAFKPPHAEVSAELAAMAFARGDYDEAKKRADEALRLDRRQLRARWILAELDRVAGRYDEAERGYRWLIRYYNDNEVEQAESLHWIGLAAAQSARWNRQSDQFHFLVNELYPDALKAEPDYWPAHYEAGMLFLEKHNQGDAAREFQAASELNPNAAEVHAALALLAMEGHDLAKAETAVARALEINPRLLDAWLVKADLLWANFQVKETLSLLEDKARPLCPTDEATLGRIAACYLLLDGQSKPDDGSRFDRLAQQAASRNPRPGEFYFALAAQLEDRNKQSLAEPYLQEAIRLMPRQIGPEAHLGMLYMLAGREAEARKTLDRAFQADPFNVRVKNSLEVLDVLGGMQTVETEHFLLKFDRERDRLLARYVAPRVEEVFPQLCRRFGYTPPQKTPIEVFSRAQGHSGHEWFSARMIGLPYLGTVAASTGRIVGMASPNDADLGHSLNWARVLRHELVHVITLQQTDFNCPHWYTEGLAVLSEEAARPQLWSELLLDRVHNGRLLNLQTINPAFTRPKSSDQWALAYCQAELYVEYMLARSGEESLQKMLAAYAEGLSTADAVRRVFGVSEEEFERGYVEFLKQQTAKLSTLKYPPKDELSKLLKEQRENPNDADAAAAVANAYLARGADREAVAAAEAARKLVPKHPLAAFVSARLLLKEKKTAEATAMLEECLDERQPEPSVLGLLASLRLKAEKYDEAARLYMLGQRLDPIHLEWTKGLAQVYLASGNESKLAETLARLAEADVDDMTVRKKLAQMALARKDYAAAESWARQAMEIGVGDAAVHGVLAEALVGCHNYSLAVEEFEAAVELNPDAPQPRFALADALIQAKQPAKARTVLKALLERVPDYPGAELLLESLKE